MGERERAGERGENEGGWGIDIDVYIRVSTRAQRIDPGSKRQERNLLARAPTRWQAEEAMGREWSGIDNCTEVEGDSGGLGHDGHLRRMVRARDRWEEQCRERRKAH